MWILCIWLIKNWPSYLEVIYSGFNCLPDIVNHQVGYYYKCHLNCLCFGIQAVTPNWRLQNLIYNINVYGVLITITTNVSSSYNLSFSLFMKRLLLFNSHRNISRFYSFFALFYCSNIIASLPNASMLKSAIVTLNYASQFGSSTLNYIYTRRSSKFTELPITSRTVAHCVCN